MITLGRMRMGKGDITASPGMAIPRLGLGSALDVLSSGALGLAALLDEQRWLAT